MSDIEDIIANAHAGEYSKANDAFDNAIQAKIGDSLEQHKAMIASQIFANAEDVASLADDAATIELDDLDDQDDDFPDNDHVPDMDDDFPDNDDVPDQDDP